MPIYTGTADANGDFNIPFGTNSYTSGEKITVTAEKDSAEKSIELYAPSSVVGGGAIQFSGTLIDFPNNIGVVTISDLGGTIQENAFRNPSDIGGSFQLKATGLSIVAPVTAIGVYAFQGWRNALTLTLPTTLISIGISAFQGWNACLELVIPNSVTTIARDAFYAWPAAKKLIIGTSVATIANNAFQNWTACDEVVCLRAAPPEITSSTFSGLKSTCIFKVPAESVAAYQAAPNWSAFASRIQAI